MITDTLQVRLVSLEIPGATETTYTSTLHSLLLFFFLLLPRSLPWARIYIIFKRVCARARFFPTYLYTYGQKVTINNARARACICISMYARTYVCVSNRSRERVQVQARYVISRNCILAWGGKNETLSHIYACVRICIYICELASETSARRNLL